MEVSRDTALFSPRTVISGLVGAALSAFLGVSHISVHLNGKRTGKPYPKGE